MSTFTGNIKSTSFSKLGIKSCCVTDMSHSEWSIQSFKNVLLKCKWQKQLWWLIVKPIIGKLLYKSKMVREIWWQWILNETKTKESNYLGRHNNNNNNNKAVHLSSSWTRLACSLNVVADRQLWKTFTFKFCLC